MDQAHKLHDWFTNSAVDLRRCLCMCFFCRSMLCISLKNLRSHMYQRQRGRAIWWPDDQLHCIVVRSSSKENPPTAPPDPPLDNVARPHTSNTRLDSIFVKGILNLSRHALPIRFDPTNSSNGANRFFYHYYVYFIFLLQPSCSKAWLNFNWNYFHFELLVLNSTQLLFSLKETMMATPFVLWDL